MKLKNNKIENLIEHNTIISNEIVDIMTNGVKDDRNSKLDEWASQNKYAEEVLQNLSNSKFLSDKIDEISKIEFKAGSNRLRKELRRRKYKSLLLRASSVAAAVIAVSFMCYNLYFKEESQTILSNVENTVKHEEIEITKPMLITTKGTQMVIDNVLVSDESSVIELTQLISVDGSNTVVDEENKLNVFIVPHRYSEKIELEDGTIVHLNSDSELRFPNSFEKKNQRRVELRGEGYFEVTKSSKPFIVNINGADIRVYGTKFNVNGYKNDVVETVLVEGSVGVSAGGKETILSPNELCLANISNGEMSTTEVDVTKYTVWTSGMFMCEKQPLSKLFEELKIWYGAEFDIQTDKIDKISITSIFSKESELDEIIESIKIINKELEYIKTERGYLIK